MGIFEIHERVEVVGNAANHNIPIGTRLTIRGYNGIFALVREMPINIMKMEFLKYRHKHEYVKETIEAGNQPSERGFREHLMHKVLTDNDMPLAEKVKCIEGIYGRDA